MLKNICEQNKMVDTEKPGPMDTEESHTLVATSGQDIEVEREESHSSIATNYEDSLLIEQDRNHAMAIVATCEDIEVERNENQSSTKEKDNVSIDKDRSHTLVATSGQGREALKDVSHSSMATKEEDSTSIDQDRSLTLVATIGQGRETHRDECCSSMATLVEDSVVIGQNRSHTFVTTCGEDREEERIECLSSISTYVKDSVVIDQERSLSSLATGGNTPSVASTETVNAVGIDVQDQVLCEGKEQTDFEQDQFEDIVGNDKLAFVNFTKEDSSSSRVSKSFQCSREASTSSIAKDNFGDNRRESSHGEEKETVCEPSTSSSLPAKTRNFELVSGGHQQSDVVITGSSAEDSIFVGDRELFDESGSESSNEYSSELSDESSSVLSDESSCELPEKPSSGSSACDTKSSKSVGNLPPTRANISRPKTYSCTFANVTKDMGRVITIGNSSYFKLVGSRECIFQKGTNLCVDLYIPLQLVDNFPAQVRMYFCYMYK